MIIATRLATAFLLAFAVNAAFAQAPNISYSSPQTYTVNSAITPLSPVNSGGSVPGRTVTTLASGLKLPKGIAYDATGNIYFAETNNNAVKKIPAGRGTPVSLGTGFKRPTGVAVDAEGNVYVSGGELDEVQEVKASDGSTVELAYLHDYPQALALDSAGDIYVTTGVTISNVYKIAAGSGTAVAVATGFNKLTGIALDAASNIYLTERALKKIPAGSNAAITLAQGFGAVTSVAVDAAGNVYFSDTNINSIAEIPAGGNAVVQLTGTFSAVSVAVTPLGVIYASDGTSVKKIDNTGYNIKPGLPPGLTFNTNTGVISGTPMAVSPATNYTITATNSIGSSTATINIAVNNHPRPPSAIAVPRFIMRVRQLRRFCQQIRVALCPEEYYQYFKADLMVRPA